MWGPAPGLAAGQAKILSMTSAAQFTRLPVVLPSRFLARAGSRYAAPASPFFVTSSTPPSGQIPHPS